MSQFNYPLHLKFHISTFANDFSIKDNQGKDIAYVRQKLLRLKEKIEVFEDTSKSNKMYTIQADQWLDFSATYGFRNQDNEGIGKISRKGWVSLWKARYHIFNKENQDQFVISEGNAWVKVMDGFFGEIPILGIFTGYFFHPSYNITNSSGQIVARLKKQSSFWGRKFSLDKLGEFSTNDEEIILLGSMMMILLERRRG